MSIWSSVEGTLIIHKSKHISVKDIITEELGVVEYIDRTSQANFSKSHKLSDHYEHSIEVHICCDSEVGSKLIERLIIRLREHCTYMDVTSAVRWYK